MYREKDFRIQTAQSMDDFKSGAKDIFTTFLTLASKQIGVFLGIFFLLLAFSSFIGRYEMLYGGTGMVYGAGASDITIGMKVLYVKIALCLVLAVTSVLAGFRKNYKMMAAGPVLLIAVALLGGVGQAAYEYLSVVPNQYTKEAPYIEKNIASTQKAYGLDKVTIKDFHRPRTLQPGIFRKMKRPSAISPSMTRNQPRTCTIRCRGSETIISSTMWMWTVILLTANIPRYFWERVKWKIRLCRMMLRPG